MNLAVRGIDADIRWNNEGSFHKDELKDLRFDYVLANPPFNVSDCPSSCPMNSASATPRKSGRRPHDHGPRIPKEGNSRLSNATSKLGAKLLLGATANAKKGADAEAGLSATAGASRGTNVSPGKRRGC
jgi:hypothetical protein